MILTLHSYNRSNCSYIMDRKGTCRFHINQNCDKKSIVISFEEVFSILKLSTVNYKPPSLILNNITEIKISLFFIRERDWSLVALF